MGTRTEAIYEGGVLRPVQPLALAEHERVTITVEPLDDLIDHEYIAQCRAEVAKMDCIPTIEETREKLRAVPDSFADEILRSRSDRSQFFNTKNLSLSNQNDYVLITEASLFIFHDRKQS